MSMYDDEREQQQEESDSLSTAKNIKNTIDKARNKKEENQHAARNDFKDDTKHGEKAQSDYNATESNISNSAQNASPSSAQSAETGKDVDTALGLANTNKLANDPNNISDISNNGQLPQPNSSSGFNNATSNINNTAAGGISNGSSAIGANTASVATTESANAAAQTANVAAQTANVAAQTASSAAADVVASTAAGTASGGPVGAAIGAGIGILIAAKDKIAKVAAVIGFILFFIPTVILTSLPTASIFNVFGWNGKDEVEISLEDKSETIKEEFDKITKKVNAALSKKQENRLYEIKYALKEKLSDLSSSDQNAAIEKSLEKVVSADADADAVDIVTIVAAYSVSLGNADSEINIKDMVKKIKNQSYIDFYNYSIGTVRHKEKAGEKEVITEETTYTKVKYYTYKPAVNKQNISYYDKDGNEKTISFYDLDQEKWTNGTANDTVYVEEYSYETITMYDQYGNARAKMAGYVPTGNVKAVSSIGKTDLVKTTEDVYVYWYEITLTPFNMNGIYKAFGIYNPNGKYYENYYTKMYDEEGNTTYKKETYDSGMTYAEAIVYYAENYYEVLFEDDDGGYSGDVVIDTSAESDSKIEGFICPLPYKGKVTINSPFQPDDRVDVNTGRNHMGIDMGVTGGTAGKTVVAAAAGKVVTSEFNAYGNFISIEHIFVDENGNKTKYYSAYGHLQNRFVKVGDEVKQGQSIALAGNTYGSGGYSTGPHLHFEIRKGSNARSSGIDPELLICSGKGDTYIINHYHCN